MRRILSAAVALAVLAVPSWAGLANRAWNGTVKSVDHGVYMLLGDTATGKGDLGIPATSDTMDLVTTGTGWTLSGGSFGNLSGTYGTIVPGKKYTGSLAATDLDTWIENRLAAQYAGVSNVAAGGAASFRPSADGTSVKVIVLVVYTAELNGTYLAGGTVKATGKLLLP